MRLSLEEEKETRIEEILYIFLGIDLCALTSTFYRNRFRYRMHFPEIVEIVHDIHSTGNRFIACALRHNASVGENIQGKKRENSTNFYHVHAHGNRILSLHANILSDSIRFLLSVSSLLACITRSVDRSTGAKHTSTHIMNSEDVTLFMCPPL